MSERAPHRRYHTAVVSNGTARFYVFRRGRGTVLDIIGDIHAIDGADALFRWKAAKQLDWQDMLNVYVARAGGPLISAEQRLVARAIA